MKTFAKDWQLIPFDFSLFIRIVCESFDTHRIIHVIDSAKLPLLLLNL